MKRQRACILAMGIFLAGALAGFSQATATKPGTTISGFSSGPVSGFAPNPVTGHAPGVVRGHAPRPVGPFATNLTGGFTPVSPLTTPLAGPQTNRIDSAPIVPVVPIAPLNNRPNNIPVTPLF